MIFRSSPFCKGVLNDSTTTAVRGLLLEGSVCTMVQYVLRPACMHIYMHEGLEPATSLYA